MFKNKFQILGHIFIVHVLFIFSNVSFAIPVVNENVANSGILTVYPDHLDSHRYYIAPNVVTISRDYNNKPRFLYQEISKGTYSVGNGLNKRTFYVGISAVAQFTFSPTFIYKEELDEVKSLILKKDPEAQFSGVPFVFSFLQENGLLTKIIKENSCSHAAGLIGQEQECTLVLTELGRNIFRASLLNRNLFTTLQFIYQINAVIKKADGSFSDVIINHGIAVRIDGNDIADSNDSIKTLD